MISIYDIIYYTIYITCLLLSFKAKESFIPGLAYLRFLLCLGLGTEVAVLMLQYLKLESNSPYYIYIPVEYYCLAKFYLSNTNDAAKRKWITASIPLYVVATLLLGFFHNHFSGYPSLIYNISCLLNSVWVSLLLFSFNMGDGKQIWKHPLFIILSSFLIFFAGIFFFNTAYTYLLKEDSGSAKTLRTYTNTLLNYILYILLSYGFLCSVKNKK